MEFRIAQFSRDRTIIYYFIIIFSNGNILFSFYGIFVFMKSKRVYQMTKTKTTEEKKKWQKQIVILK